MLYLEIRHLFPSTNSYYAFVDPDIDQTKTDCIRDLKSYIALEGPFDIVMGFSQGATVAASLIVHEVLNDSSSSSFKGAIFFCGSPPFVATNPDDTFRKLSTKTDGEVIPIPTAHIIGQSDDLFSEAVELKELCAKGLRSELVHHGGHEIPHGKSEVRRMVEAITNVLDAVVYAQ